MVHAGVVYVTLIMVMHLKVPPVRAVIAHQTDTERSTSFIFIRSVANTTIEQRVVATSYLHTTGVVARVVHLTNALAMMAYL